MRNPAGTTKDAEAGKLAIADVETTMLADGERPKTKFWGLYVEGETYRRFNTSREFARYLEGRKDKLLIYHHHDFDPIQYISDGESLTIRDVRSGRLLRCMGPGEHEWRNSYALFPAGLKTILTECGFAKPGLDDLEARNIADTVDTAAAFRMLADAYEKVWNIYPLARQYLTASGVAFAAAQRVAGRLPEDLDFRMAYTGGRVEAFRIGYCGEATAYDINSSYPAAFLDVPDHDLLLPVAVEIETDGPSPCWTRSDDGDKLLFPVGRFHTWLWASNYERYIKPHGRVKKLELLNTPYHVDLRWVKEVASLISEVYQARADAKRDGRNVEAYAAKLGLNSIYGRLGLKPEREIAVTKDAVASDDDVKYYPLPDGRYLSFVEIVAKVSANYPFAAIITDNARCRLYDALEKAGEPYYCDTDSVFLPSGHEFDVKTGSALGEWKPEGTAHLSIQGAKDYAFGPLGGVETLKRDDGASYWVDAEGREIRDKLGHEKFALKGGKGHFEWSIRRALSQKGARRIEKTRQSEYDKRNVNPDGSTYPLYMETW